MPAEGKKVIVLLENMFNEHELFYPYFRLKEAGATPVMVAPEAGKTYKSKIGMTAVSEAASADINIDEYDGVVIPGGYSPDLMRRDEAMKNIVATLHTQGKVVAAICHAGWMLCSCGILKGKRVTCFYSVKDDVVNAGAEWFDEEVVQDGKLITSRTPDDLPAFMKAIIQAL
jgi:protease I